MLRVVRIVSFFEKILLITGTFRCENHRKEMSLCKLGGNKRILSYRCRGEKAGLLTDLSVLLVLQHLNLGTG